MPAPISPGRGHTIAQLRRLQADHWHNPDTGTELQAGEAETHLKRLEQNVADRKVHTRLTQLARQKYRSRHREWVPSDKVVFRMIHGHVVPFRKEADPFL